MAILSSTKSRHRASSNPQVPLVIISQPLPGPITDQNSRVPQVRPETANQSSSDGASVAAASAELVLEVNHISSEPEESSSATRMTSLPVADGEPTREDTPTPGEEVLVSLFIFHSLHDQNQTSSLR